MKPIQTVGVLGAGTMGAGIAQACALNGFDVLLHDVNPEQIRKGLEQIETGISKLVSKHQLTSEEGRGAMGKVKACQWEELKADLVIEAVVENLEIKNTLFHRLELINDADAIFASNTSSISIAKIARGLKHPERCIGLHFFNPVHAMKLVEIVQWAKSSRAVVARIGQFSESIGKTAVHVKDSPGFIVNRVARHFYVESLQLLEDRVIEFSDLDRLMESAGFRMGPFRLMDLIGIDVNFAVTQTMYDAFYQHPKFRPSRTQEQKINEGDLGIKTGKGFYDYDKKN